MGAGGAVVEELLEGAQWSVHCACGPGLFVGTASRVTRSYPRVVASARRLLEQVGNLGIANVQFFDRDGEMLVHDVNLRPPASLGIAIRAGLELPRIAVDAALGRGGPVAGAIARRFSYVAVDRELSALRHPPEGESAAGIARGLARAAASPSTVLDPPLHDVFWVADIAARGAARAGVTLRRLRPRGDARAAKGSGL